MSYDPILEHPDNISKENYNGRILLICNSERRDKKNLFEHFGFTFEDFSDEIINLVCEGKKETNPQDLSCPLHRFSQAVLPNGWKMQPISSKDFFSFILLDQNNDKRGEYYSWLYHPGWTGDYTGKIEFFPKFRTTSHYTGEHSFGPVLISVRDSNDNILFTAGEAESLSNEYYKLIAVANDYLKKHYPECEEDYYSGFFHTKLDKYWD